MPKFALLAALASRLGLVAILVAGSAASAVPPLSVYGNLPGFEKASISSSGDHVALIGSIDQKRRLLILDKDKKPVGIVAIEDQTKIHDLLWVGDSMVLVETSVTSDTGGDFTTTKAELVGMMVVPLDGSKPWSVFASDRLIRGGINGFYGINQRDGKYYGYFGGMTYEPGNMGGQPYLTSGKPHLYEVDLQTHVSKLIARRPDGEQIDRTWLVDTNGVPAVTLDFDSRDGSWRINGPDRAKIASGVQKFGEVGLLGFGSTPGTFMYGLTDGESGEVRWYETPLAGGPAREIFPDQAIAGTYFDRRSRQLIGYRHRGDAAAYTFFDAYQAKVVAATQKAFPKLDVDLVEWNDAFNRLIVQTNGVGDAQTWWLVDIKTGNADILGTSYPIRAGDVGPMRMITYKAGDGLEIAAVLTLPPGLEAKNLPVVVLPHGGPASRDYARFDWWAQAIAARGYAVLQPNFRGSSGYGAAFRHAGDGEWGRKMQSDISDGLAELAKQGMVDPKRACIVGGSYGGYAALAGVTVQQGVYRCAVSYAGISDVAKMVTTDTMASNGDQTLVRSLKREIGSGHDLAEVSPIHFASRADAPILLIHGKDDTVVNYGQSSDMAAALRRANKPVEFITLPETDHWLTHGDTRLAMLEATIAFVEKYNPPDAPKP